MQFHLFLLPFLSLCSALPAIPQAGTQDLAPQLLTTVGELNTAVVGLTAAVNDFDGTFLGLLPQAFAVIAAETKVDFTILKATHITSQSSNFTAAESTQIVQSLASQIGPIQASLDALKAKYPEFKKTLTSPVVLIDLNILKKHTNELIDAITEKVTPDNAGLLGFGALILGNAFDSAIAVYQA